MEKTMDLAISINPTYRCNMNCDFCYLNNLHNSQLMDLDKLEQQLKDITTMYSIKYIDIYGGEITLLEDDYLNRLISICEQHTSSISFVSNFVNLTDWLLNLKYPVGTSWDYKFRQYNEQILDNIDKYYQMTNKRLSVLLCSPKLYDYKEEVLKYLNRESIESFSLIPCMKSQYNDVEYDFQKYEETIKYFIENKIEPIFINEEKLNYDREVYKHIFINPNNEYVDVRYNNGIESFENVDINTLQLNIPKKCLTCKHFNRCLNEHVDSYIEDSYDCIGCYKLIDWYNNERRIEE